MLTYYSVPILRTNTPSNITSKKKTFNQICRYIYNVMQYLLLLNSVKTHYIQYQEAFFKFLYGWTLYKKLNITTMIWSRHDHISVCGSVPFYMWHTEQSFKTIKHVSFVWFRIINIFSKTHSYHLKILLLAKMLLELANIRNWAYSIDGAISIKLLANVTFDYTLANANVKQRTKRKA